MSDNFGNINWGEIPVTRMDNQRYLDPMMSQSHHVTTSQYGIMSSQSYTPMAGHDNYPKLVSITDSLIDEGIGSLSITDSNASIPEKTKEPEVMCRETSTDTKNLQAHEKSLPAEVQEVSIGYSSMPENTNETGLKSLLAEGGYESMPDDNTALYIPEKGYSLLHMAILYRNTDEAIDLIQVCPSPELLDFFTPDLHTALHLAVYADVPEVVRFLVVYGANVNFRDKRGNTALHTACELGRKTCVRMLLSPLEGVECFGLQEAKIPQDINEKNYEGLTPLHLATIHDNSDIVGMLSRHPNIEVNLGDSNSGRTALHHALERRSTKTFYLLLQMSSNVNAITYDGCSPLHLAVGLGLENETRSLMTRGASVSIRTGDDTRVSDLAKTPEIKDALLYSTMQVMKRPMKQR